MSIASICSVTLIVPISEAMLEPTLPARINARIDDENSSKRISREAYPTVYAGMNGEVMLSSIWITITAPINTDIIKTKGIESTPNLLISNNIFLKNSLHLSGILNT